MGGSSALEFGSLEGWRRSASLALALVVLEDLDELDELDEEEEELEEEEVGEEDEAFALVVPEEAADS